MTDDTIIIKCGECDVEATGVNAMTAHVIDNHPDYSDVEARFYAERWTEDAHKEWDQFQGDYSEQRKLDQAIESDAFPNK